jgi:hypothetical protein
VWSIVGTVWLYSSDDCASDWTEGYVITLIILTLKCIQLVLVYSMWIFFWGVAVGHKSASEQHKVQSEYDPVQARPRQYSLKESQG